MKSWSALWCLLIISWGCSSQEVAIKRVEAPTILDTIDYSTYWTAMRMGMPELVDRYNPNQEEREFADALAYIKNNNYTDSETILENLKSSVQDTLLKDNTNLILASLYINNSKWKEYYSAFKKKDETEKNAISRMIYPAFKELTTNTLFSKDIDTIKIEIKKGLIFAPIQINGKEYDFIFDTGAQFTILSDEVVKDANVDLLGEHESALLGSTGKTSKMHTVSMKNIGFGPFEAENFPGVSTNKSNLEFKWWFYKFLTMDGLIGWDIIKQLDVEIDCKNEIMIIRKPVHKNIVGRNMFWLDHPIVQVKSASGIDLLFFLDLGAKHSTLYDMLLNKVKIDGVESEDETRYGIGGSTKKEYKVIPSLSLIIKDQLITFKNIKSEPTDNTNFIIFDGVFGNDIGIDNIIRLDATNGLFEITHN